MASDHQRRRSPAAPGEGVWKPAGPAIGGRPTRPRHDVPAGPRLPADRRLRRVVRPHANGSSRYYPGRYEPPARHSRPDGSPARPALAAARDVQRRLHLPDGLNGDRAERRHVNEPLKQGLATLVAYKDGRVDIVAGTAARSRAGIAWARQSLPLIVDHGRLNPRLNDSTAWGYTLGNAVRVWRTGVGVDRHGNIIYAAADYQTVTTLARDPEAGRSGARDGARHQPGVAHADHVPPPRGPAIPTRSCPNYQQPATRYLVPDDRDFFAVYRRVPGSVGVPLR